MLFFDGHAAAMFPTKIDPGWDKPLGQRLRWFTRVDREDLW